MIEGEYPAFVARKKLFLYLPLLNPPSDLAAFINVCSVQMSHHVLDIHGWSKGQHSSHWQVNVLMCPCKQSFKSLYGFQPCALGMLMMACSSKDVKHLGSNARQMLIVVCKLLSSDKDLDLICHMVVLHPECRCSSSFCKSRRFLQTSPQTLPLLGLCFWLLSSYQPLSPCRPSYHHTTPHDQWRQVLWCADR